MTPLFLRRFIIVGVLLSLATFVGALGIQYLSPPPGDYETRQGDIHLSVQEYDPALEAFDRALVKQPDHRGALMGRAIVFMQSGRWKDAEAAFEYLIDYLDRTLQPDDATGKGALAAAHANLGILYDRQGRYQQAFDQYVASLRTDDETVAGPGLVEKILHNPRPSTVRDRARYLWQQLQLPPEQRVMTNPTVDAEQRMYKP